MTRASPDGQLYTATVSDFSGSDPLIYKEPLRTEQYDSKILNSKFCSFASIHRGIAVTWSTISKTY